MKLLITILLTITSIYSQTLTAKQIVEKSDKIRNPSNSFYEKGLITQFENAKKVDSMLISVYAKEINGQYKTLVKILKPKRDKDKVILRDGNSMWMYDPNSNAIAQISPQQRLMGQSSSSDVVSANFALDYKLTLEKEESIRGGDKKQVLCYKIKMKAVSNEVSYPFVEYWVAKNNFYPIHVKFYSSSKNLLKMSYYRKFKKVIDRVRPTEVLIFDGVDINKATKLNFSNAKHQDIPNFWFNKEYLSKFNKN